MAFPIQIPDMFSLGIQNCLEKAQRSDQLEDRQLPVDHGSPDNGTNDDEDDGNYDHQPPPKEGSENRWGYDKRDEGESGYGNQGQGEPDGGGNQGQGWSGDGGNQGQGANGPYQDSQGDGGGSDGNDQVDGGGSNGNDQWDGGDPNGNDEGNSDYAWKRSDATEDTPATTTPSTDSQTLEELVFFLKLITCVLFSGYALILAYFVVPTRRNHRLQAEYRVHAVVPPSVSVQDSKV